MSKSDTDPLPTELPQDTAPEVSGLQSLLSSVAHHLLGHEALESLRGRRWTLVGVIGLPLGFIADIFTVFSPVAGWAFEITGILFLILGAAVVLRTRFCRRCAFPCVVSLSLALSFGLVVVTQKLAGASEKGVLAQISAFAELQDNLKSIVEWLGVIDSRTQGIAKDIAGIRSDMADFRALGQQLVATSTSKPGPGADAPVSQAVTAIAQGASEGDARLQQALDLLKQNKVEDATRLLQAYAADKTARIAADSKAAAAAYRNLGAIAGLRDPKRALDAYVKAAELDPSDVESLFWAGYLEADRGELADAKRRLLRVMAQTVGQDWYQFWGYTRLGDIAMQQGDRAGALKSYQGGLSVAEGQAYADPGNAEWQRELAVPYERVGDVLVAQGDRAGALKSYRDSLAIRERLAQADRGNAEWQRDLSVSYDKVGDVLVAQGDRAGALKFYRDGLVIAEQLAQTDRGNAEWQRDLATSYERVGDVLVAQGDRAGGLNYYRDSLAIRERLARADPGNAQWQMDLLRGNWRLAEQGSDTKRRLALIIDGLRKLKAADKLTAEQIGYLPVAEAELARSKSR